MSGNICLECSHELADHWPSGCTVSACSCERNRQGKIPGEKADRQKTGDDIRSRLEALASRGRPSGPALREIADEVAELQEHLENATRALEELMEAADSYENAEEGRDGVEERADAWDAAQTAAGDLRWELAHIDAILEQ
jgi:chromosome segregation ATPase